jgi:hypothetical protein
MGDILVGQRNFCIWLGEASGDSDQTMEFVGQVSQLGNPDQLVKDNGSVEKWRSLSSLMGLSRRLPFPGMLPCVAGLRRPDGQTSRTLSCYLATDSPRSSIYSPATDQVLPKHEAGTRLGNVKSTFGSCPGHHTEPYHPEIR